LAKNNVSAKNEITMAGRWANLKQYVVNIFNELKKVHWPNRQQLIAYTIVVLISVALVALIIWLFDSGVSLILQMLFESFA
jgi:preprotein translocase subunit SecE